MQRLGREAPLPQGMQGHWIDPLDPASELIVSGGEITCLGETVEYVWKDVDENEGAFNVTLSGDEDEDEDSSATGTSPG